ncbi:MAG: HisA/HisF-related TIM barrel protein, partial [Gammaproteobacteria bacterium]
MKIFPAIDIKDGACVRLTQGNFESVTKYNHDPLSQARLFLQHGFLNLHIVDLNGAKDGQRKNISQLNEILLLSQLSIQFGGGVRTLNEIRNLLKLGVNRVIVGTS